MNEYRRTDDGIEVPDREVRSFAKFEFRNVESDGLGGLIIDGYATVYDFPYDIGELELGGFTERMARGSGAKTVSEADVPLLMNHRGMTLARTKSGTLTLESDDIGVRMEAGLDLRNPFSMAAASAIDRGDIDEMSIGFRAVRQDWSDDYTMRTINEFRIVDVTMANKGANGATVLQTRTSAPVSTPTRSLRLARSQYEATLL